MSRLDDFLKDYPEHWPPKDYFNHESIITKEQIDELEELIKSNAGETDIDNFISKNPIILTIPLDFVSTGHHGAWVVPKKEVRARISTGIPGLIPDFIIGGKSSVGFSWNIVELKGSNESLFSSTNDKLYFSGTANKGICQLLEYIDSCSKAQAHIRDSLQLRDFREPNGFLIIGRENEFYDPRKRDLKAAWNRKMNTIHIRSYDALLRTCKRIYDSYHKGK